MEATGLSQPTITRAIAALTAAGLVTERNDLAQARGRGRPTVPLELGEPDTIHAGVSVGTQATYVALFDLKGRSLTATDIDIPVAELSQDDFIQHIMAGVNRLAAAVNRPLATIGVTTSGTITANGLVLAPNLGWRGVDIGEQMREQFEVPVVVTSAADAIVGSEVQSRDDLDTRRVMALFVDDSIGCAIARDAAVDPITVEREDLTTQGLIHAIDLAAVRTLDDAIATAQTHPSVRAALDERARHLGALAGKLISAHCPDTVVVAGSAFLDDPAAPSIFARAVRSDLPASNKINLRMIPTHAEMVRDIARAVALDLVLREPLAVART